MERHQNLLSRAKGDLALRRLDGAVILDLTGHRGDVAAGAPDGSSVGDRAGEPVKRMSPPLRKSWSVIFKVEARSLRLDFTGGSDEDAVRVDEIDNAIGREEPFNFADVIGADAVEDDGAGVWQVEVGGFFGADGKVFPRDDRFVVRVHFEFLRSGNAGGVAGDDGRIGGISL